MDTNLHIRGHGFITIPMSLNSKHNQLLHCIPSTCNADAVENHSGEAKLQRIHQQSTMQKS